MTHSCSVRMTHTKNKICPWARNGIGDFIHAEGVQALCIPGATPARGRLWYLALRPCPPAKMFRSVCFGVSFHEQSRVISPECRSKRWSHHKGDHGSERFLWRHTFNERGDPCCSCRRWNSIFPPFKRWIPGPRKNWNSKLAAQLPLDSRAASSPRW
jgi:hypothetical protein